MRLDAHQRDWDELAELDPLWAVMTCKEKHLGKWDPREVFDSGKREIEPLMRKIAGLLGARKRSLDFGCGVGRFTSALSGYFTESNGLDISDRMVEKAKEFSPQCKF